MKIWSFYCKHLYIRPLNNLSCDRTLASDAALRCITSYPISAKKEDELLSRVCKVILTLSSEDMRTTC